MYVNLLSNSANADEYVKHDMKFKIKRRLDKGNRFDRENILATERIS